MYDSYAHYRGARDAAWRILLDAGIGHLPVDLTCVIRHLNILAVTYAESPGLLSYLASRGRAVSEDGFTVLSESGPVILYGDAVRPEGRRRFTMAHELGHIILGHRPDESGVLSRWNRWDAENSDPREAEANIFASRLMAPARVLHALGAYSVYEIMELTGLSYTAALIRAERMAELARRGAWDRSPLERRVYERFIPWINSVKGQ